MNSILTIAAIAASAPLLLLVHFILICRTIKRNMEAEREDAIVAYELAAQRYHETRVGLSLEDIAKLPTYEYNNSRDGDKLARSGTELTCSVCMEMFISGEKCRLLPSCKHAFHAHCVDSWLVKCLSCPICRKDVHRVDAEEEEHLTIVIAGS
ncbi:hypothetical protein LUZ60_005399 [Juncus effusus]|nr:hypothetical protein LUZ60_005399 [Juncus effusus]